MGSKRVKCLWDAARHGLAVRITCLGCRHAVLRDPAPLWTLFVEKSWPGGFDRAGERFRCRRCGHRGARVQGWNGGDMEAGKR